MELVRAAQADVRTAAELVDYLGSLVEQEERYDGLSARPEPDNVVRVMNLHQVKGLEAPMHDPRAFHGLGLAYAMSIRGACHLSHADLFAEQGGVVMPEAGIEGPYVGQSSDGKANLVFVTENLGALLQSMGMCMFGAAPLELADFTGMLNSAAGRDYTDQELLKIGERLWLLKRSLNNMMGVTVEDDKLPKKILTATKEGGQAGSVPDIEAMMKEYYDLRGLDMNGVPKKDRLENVGLADVAAKL